MEPMEGVRLQKFLAARGYGSRRACEEAIKAGRVKVNGITATLGQSVVEGKDRVEVEGAPVGEKSKFAYAILNKPKGYVTTVKDPHASKTVGELVPVGLVPVGRLDKDTTGLLLFTNDGELALRLTHPSYGVEKTYRAVVHGRLNAEILKRLTKGIELEDGVTQPCKIEMIEAEKSRSVVEVTVKEGRKRLIRRMFKAVGCHVAELHRTRIGPLRLARLAIGESRALLPSELRALRQEAGL